VRFARACGASFVWQAPGWRLAAADEPVDLGPHA